MPSEGSSLQDEHDIEKCPIVLITDDGGDVESDVETYINSSETDLVAPPVSITPLAQSNNLPASGASKPPEAREKSSDSNCTPTLAHSSVEVSSGVVETSNADFDTKSLTDEPKNKHVHRSLSGLEIVPDKEPPSLAQLFPSEGALNKDLSEEACSESEGLQCVTSVSPKGSISGSKTKTLPASLGPDTECGLEYIDDEMSLRPGSGTITDSDELLKRKAAMGTVSRKRDDENPTDTRPISPIRHDDDETNPLPSAENFHADEASATEGQSLINQNDRQIQLYPQNDHSTQDVTIPEAFLVEDAQLYHSRSAILAVEAEPLHEEPMMPWWKHKKSKILLFSVLFLMVALAVALGTALSSNSEPIDPIPAAKAPNGQAGQFPSLSPSQSFLPSLSSLPSHEPSFSTQHGATVEIWRGIIRDNDPPDMIDTLTDGLQIYGNRRETFGMRLRSLIVPPETGTYYLYIASGGHSELYLSCGQDEANKKRVAYTSLTPPPDVREWERFSSQMSDPLSLTKGKSYYIEARYQYTDLTYVDHLEIGWKSEENSIYLSVIESSYVFLRHLLPDNLWQSTESVDTCFLPYCGLDEVVEVIFADYGGYCFKLTLNQTSGVSSLLQGVYGVDCSDNNFEFGDYSVIGYNTDAELTSSNDLVVQDGDSCAFTRRSAFIRLVVDPFIPDISMSISEPYFCYYEYVINTPNCSMIAETALENPSLSFSPSISPAPSVPPSASLAPSSSSAPSETCYTIHVAVLLDKFPNETKWEIIRADPTYQEHYENTIVFQSKSHQNVISYFYDYDMCLIRGQYTFAIHDSEGDGICCHYGKGYYNITSDGEVIALGGIFESDVNVTFTIPVVPLPSQNPSVSSAPSSTLTPSEIPSTSPAPSLSLAPAVSCYWIQIEVFFDEFPLETSWELLRVVPANETKTEEVVVISYLSVADVHNEGADPGTLSHYIQEECLIEGQYEFTIYDEYGDGICCFSGYGNYSIMYNGELIAQGGEFNKTEGTSFEILFVGSTTTTISSPSEMPAKSYEPTITGVPISLTHRPTYASTIFPTSLIYSPTPINAADSISPIIAYSRTKSVSKNYALTQRENLIRKHLSAFFENDDYAQDPIHARAIHWIVYNDPLESSPIDPLFMQRYVLVLFYYATDGPGDHGGWKGWVFLHDGMANNWLLDTPDESECLWSGISCVNMPEEGIEERQIVVSIDARAFGLVGNLPKEVSYLTHLQELNLSLMNYSLTGAIHLSILNMPSLKKLSTEETSLRVIIECNANTIDVITGECNYCHNDCNMICHGGCCTDAVTGALCT